jgi:drug/metabolite transporter (DMT)-like permease
MVIFAYFILHEKITWKKWLSVIMSTMGVIIIVGIGNMQGGMMGGCILLLAAASWGLISIWVKQVSDEYPTVVITMYCMIISAVCLTPMELSTINSQTIQAVMAPDVLAEIIYIILVPTTLAYYLWNKGLTMVDASTGGMYFFFQPVIGTFLGWIFLGESIGLSFMIGTALILSGIILVVRE